MKALEVHMKKINKVEADINKTKSWKRKNDLIKYHKRLKRELREYIAWHNK